MGFLIEVVPNIINIPFARVGLTDRSGDVLIGYIEYARPVLEQLLNGDLVLIRYVVGGGVRQVSRDIVGNVQFTFLLKEQNGSRCKDFG